MELAREATSMHKMNVHRNTESLRRTARASQARLDEISDKIDRDKRKIIKSSQHQKAKVLNELKLIHRVFEPRLDVIKEIKEGLQAENLTEVSKDDTVQNRGNHADDKNVHSDDLAESLEQPRSSRRPESQTATSATRRRHTERKMWRPFGESMPALAQSSSQADLGNPPLSFRRRSYRWCPPNHETGQPRLSVQIEREYLAKLRNAVEKPCVSEPMSSLSLGYIAFKRALKDKRRSERFDPKFVDPKFKSVFLDTAELSAIPEHTVSMSENNDFKNPHLVKKNNSLNSDFSERLPTPISKHHSLPLLDLPMGDPLIKRPEARRSLLNPDLLYAKCSEVTALKEGKRKPNNATGNYIREGSSKSEGEEMFGTFDEEAKKTSFSNKRQARFRSCASTLLRPLGTGCFSASFQAANHMEKYK